MSTYNTKETQENSIAIGKLVAISERTTKDIDRLVSHIEEMLPVHSQIIGIKKIGFASMTAVVGFGAWVTVEFMYLSQTINSHIVVEVVKDNKDQQLKKKQFEKIEQRVTDLEKKTTEEINTNKNQITYLKGRIKK